jgi:hypothetical protein
LFAAEGEDLVDAAADAGVEPVELLIAGENIVPELLGEVSTLGHAPRVIGIFRRDSLPVGTRDVVLGLWQVADPGNVGTLFGGRCVRSALRFSGLRRSRPARCGHQPCDLSCRSWTGRRRTASLFAPAALSRRSRSIS